LPLAGFQKCWALCFQLFKRELFFCNLFAGFQNLRDCPLLIFKSFWRNSETLSFNGSKGFYLAGFKNLLANSKTIRAEPLRTY
jgi:hypothetical protein